MRRKWSTTIGGIATKHKNKQKGKNPKTNKKEKTQKQIKRKKTQKQIKRKLFSLKIDIN